ncbi:uncharacterized protein [Venturia canescens]|uniref:uncharacterized protein isoform X2 n=1 Tax=Venturia canescens TaxID=32260 RepID=UPI001C9C0F6F|nr:uncharacterized protein LOC122417715 isoform X2 [Venturia canescens]
MRSLSFRSKNSGKRRIRFDFQHFFYHAARAIGCLDHFINCSCCRLKIRTCFFVNNKSGTKNITRFIRIIDEEILPTKKKMDLLSNNWRKTKKGVLAKLQYLLVSGQWSDCIFLVGIPPCQEFLKAHKVHLALSSPVFETMFFGSMSEGTEPIKVPDVEPATFKAMLKFIYTNELSLPHLDRARDLYCCANKYMMPDLAENCSIYMKSNLVPGKTPVSAISVLYEQANLAIDSENDLYKALLEWSKAECRRKALPHDQKSLRSVADEPLSRIRFLTLTPTEFADGPGKAEILDRNEILAVLMNLVSDKSTIPVPPGFSNEKNPRNRVRHKIPIKSCEELHCHRNSYPTSSNIFNNGEIRCYLSFRVDTNIKIHGITVPTQVSEMSRKPREQYVEDMVVVLLVPNETSSWPTKYSIDYKDTAIRDSTVDIRFNRAIVLKSHVDYRIVVKFNKRGRYPVGNIDRASKCDDVLFAFYHEEENYNKRDDLIRGIFFSKLFNT